MIDLEKKMQSAIDHFEKELNSLRTSRANPTDDYLIRKISYKDRIRALSTDLPGRP